MNRHTTIQCVITGFIAAAIFVFGTNDLRAQAANPNPPALMTYQGFLTDGNGTALATNAPKNFDVIFRIWDGASAGNLLWAEQQTVTVDKGYFSVLLGEGSSTGEPRPALNTIFTNSTASDRWVGLTVKGIGAGGADVSILPRLRLLTAPYSFLANRALTVASTATIVDGSLSTNVALRNASQSFSGVNTFNSSVAISGANTLEFGSGVAGKEPNAGKIGYQAFTAGFLDIVGAGTNNNRKIKFWNEGGADFTGPITATYLNGNGANLTGVAKLGSANSYTAAQTFGSSFYPVGIDLYGRLNLWSPFGPWYGTGIILNDTKDSNSGNQASFGWTLNAGEWSTDAQTRDATLRCVGGKLLLQTGTGASAICINTANYVGVGTTSPNAPLTVQNASDPRIRVQTASGSYAEFFRSGGVGSGGAVFIQLNNSQWSSANRWAYYDGDSNWDFPSDRNFKKDIVDAESMLDRVLKVQVRRYRWKDEPEQGKHMLGVIAQEVQPLFPDLVTEVQNPDTKDKSLTVGYGDFALIAIKSIQELKKQQDDETSKLKAQIAQLAAQNEQLQTQNRENGDRLAALERLVHAQQLQKASLRSESLTAGK